MTVKGASEKANGKRPDVVLYVNGIALGVLELKRSTVSVAEGIRQNLDNQKKEFIQPFFSTMQWLMVGNDSEGLRYAAIGTPEKYWLRWVEEDVGAGLKPAPTTDSEPIPTLDRHLLQVCEKARLLELIHDFVVFDAGIKKLCRQNQYFGVKAAQDALHRREGGIIWHTQGSGKSLTMVWLEKWIRENRPGARVLIITDSSDLDEQIEKVFKGVNEAIYRTQRGADLIEKLNGTEASLICSLVHKFGGDVGAGFKPARTTGFKPARTTGFKPARITGLEPARTTGFKPARTTGFKPARTTGLEPAPTFIEELKNLPPGFQAKGDLHVFVDE